MESPQSLPNSPNSLNNSLTYAYLLKKYGLVISWQDAARETGVYWETLRRLCARGEIPIEKVGRSWLLTTKALADYIDYGPASKWQEPETGDIIMSPEAIKRKPKQKRGFTKGFTKYVKPKPAGGDAV